MELLLSPSCKHVSCDPLHFTPKTPVLSNVDCLMVWASLLVSAVRLDSQDGGWRDCVMLGNVLVAGEITLLSGALPKH